MHYSYTLQRLRSHRLLFVSSCRANFGSNIHYKNIVNGGIYEQISVQLAKSFIK